MRFLNPIDCEVAQDCLRKGNALEAARILLASKDRTHRCVRSLLLEIGPRLAEQSRQALADSEAAVAQQLIECASQCVPLAPDHEALRDQIRRQVEEATKDRQWREARIRQATVWAEEGRLFSAIVLMGPLEDDPEAVRRILDWQERLDRLQRYVGEFQEYLDRNEPSAAEAVLRKARQLGQAHPQVICMERALAQFRADTDGLVPTAASSGMAARPLSAGISAPLDDRGKSFGLSGLSLGHILVVSQPAVLVGTKGADWVQLAMVAPLHRQHALILREPDPAQHRPRYRVVPCAGCDVSVRGVPAGDSAVLADGDTVQFGNEHCRWTFRQPVPDSGTAILERAIRSSGCVCSRDGTEFSMVVLLADRLVIAPPESARACEVHLEEPELPARSVHFEWKSECLTVNAEWEEAGGNLFVKSGDGTLDAESEPLLMPCDLGIYADMCGMDLVDRSQAGRLRLRIWDPNRLDKEP